MSKNARVRVIQRTGYKSYCFYIARNWRDKDKGGATNHKTVAYLGTIKEHYLVEPKTQKDLWLRIDLTLNRLLKSGEITNQDKAKIEKRFAEFCPRPMLSSPVPTKPKVTVQSVREKYGF